MSHGSAGYTPGAKIWMDGRLVEWGEAKIHIVAHVIQYGSGVFEGIRVYKTASGNHAFRLSEHLERLLGSAKIYRMESGYSLADLTTACLDTAAVSGLESCYIRPLIYRGSGNVGVNPLGCPINVAIAVWQWGAYLGADGLEQGIDARVSSWCRLANNTMPALAKATANYMNAQLIKAEALLDGYAEGIALNTDGTVSEGSGENIFLVVNGKLLTPALSDSILSGITRNTVLTLAADLGIEVKETPVPREMLYLADEVFFCGTAAEITPVRSIDKITVGAGRRGAVTEKIQKAFFEIVRGETADRHGWLTRVPAAAVAAVAAAGR
ncbi:MAG: branched-chain amino acid transaminase [Candidatus Eisenbacteria bacterium]|nr:branched-chain amino acid transaminase [Candidatus Eisenbacteria bacterium]